MQRRTTILIAASATGLLALGAAGYLLVDDPEEVIEPVRISGVTAGDTSGSGEGAGGGDGTTRSVDGLERLTGELRSGDDPDDWSVAGVDVDFGPEQWLLGDPEQADLDGDGETKPVLEELRALEGQEVDLGVRYEEDDDGDDDGEGADRDDAEVFTVNGATYRDPDGAAPWEAAAEQGGADRDAVATAAEKAVGEGARAVDVDRGDVEDGAGWDVEVHGADGQEYEVLLDASGKVVDVRADTGEDGDDSDD
ncbi:PepSY domain-containing protein [Nocardiopsis potens]|uniref:PepSY domain-containing protein n=1 Tax=Nocardiopsis potens TaxID=1246458 RepID=UPI00034D909E|nr:PepSY domain-containing protein [Nocardiopsis potens]